MRQRFFGNLERLLAGEEAAGAEEAAAAGEAGAPEERLPWISLQR